MSIIRGILLALTIGFGPVQARAAGAGADAWPSFAQAQAMPTAQLADRVLGKTRPDIVDAHAELFSGASKGADDSYLIEFAEAPRRTAYPNLCSVRVITIILDPLQGRQATRLETVSFKRAAAGETACPSGKLLPLEAFGYFQGRGPSDLELSPAEAHFVVTALALARRGAARVTCDDRDARSEFCGRRDDMLRTDPLPGLSGADLSRCGRQRARLCVTIDRDVGLDKFVRQRVETNASSVSAATFSLTSVSFSTGPYRRGP